jgi:hypothetical protein
MIYMKIISPQMAAYNKAALIMAYKNGATSESQARQMAGSYKIAEVEKFIRKLVAERR